MDRCNLWPWHAVIKILIRSIWLLLFQLAIFLGIVSRKIPTLNSAETFVCCVFTYHYYYGPHWKRISLSRKYPTILSVHSFCLIYLPDIYLLTHMMEKFRLWPCVKNICGYEMISMSAKGKLQEFKNSFHASQFTSVCSAWVFLAQ